MKSDIYEIYIDSLFLVNFVMNLYLYTLVAKTLKRTATRIRVFCGSLAGAVLFCILLLLPGIPAFVKRFIGPMIISMTMTAVIFKIKQIPTILRCTGYLFIYGFFFGGVMEFLFSGIPFLRNRQESIWCILGAGIMGYQAVSWLLAQIKQKRLYNICAVHLCGYGNEVMVEALIDTGNSLREPISGKPVSVVEDGILDKLAGVKVPEKLKLVPYHSIGKNNGIMEGYEIPEIIIEDEEGELRWQKMIVGISKNKISASGKYQMILHPDLCNKAVRLSEAAFVNQKTRRRINDF